MAFGFLKKVKKVFSFGKNKVEEVPAEESTDAAVDERDVTADSVAAKEKVQAEAAAKAEQERLQAEEHARLEAERKAAEEAEAARLAEEAEARAAAERAEAERVAAEAATKAEEEARAEEQARIEAERKAAEEAEAARLAEEAEARTAAERAEAERVAAEAATKAEEEARAEEQARIEAERIATEEAEAARLAAEAEAKAAEEREQAELAAAEAAAKAEEEQRAAEEQARVEAERIAAEEAEAARLAAESDAKSEPEEADETATAEDKEPELVSVSETVERAPAEEPQQAPAPEPEKRSWFQRLKQGLSRSSKELTENITGIFTKRKLDEDTLQDLEDVLIQADLGIETAMRITDALSAGRYGKDISTDEVRAIMGEEMEKVLGPVAQPLQLDLSHTPHVILVVGVNGTGKTTTIGKLAAKLKEGGLSVTLAAGDTFRAAAIEQLKIWGERTGSPVVSSKLGADAAGLAYDAFEQAKEAGSDVLIIDTAGRLQNRTELMDELAKIVRVLGKHDPEAPHTVLQTLDATTGQNALSQVEIFRNVAGVNGLVMTKLDGTARGGILVAIAAKHKLPVYFVGVGEQVADLEPFEAKEFAMAITGAET